MTVLARGLLLFGAFLCLLAAVVLVANTGLPERASFTGILTSAGLVAPELNAVAPPFTAVDLNGASVSLSEFRGTPVIINFWATWCAPCAAEMPQLQGLYEAYPEGDLRVIGVNLGEERGRAERFNLTFDLVLDPAGEIASLYRLRGQPSTYVVSADGVITDIFYGPVTLAQLQAALPAAI